MTCNCYSLLYKIWKYRYSQKIETMINGRQLLKYDFISSLRIVVLKISEHCSCFYFFSPHVRVLCHRISLHNHYMFYEITTISCQKYLFSYFYTSTCTVNIFPHSMICIMIFNFCSLFRNSRPGMTLCVGEDVKI